MATLRSNADILNGSTLMVFIDNDPVAFATSHTINFTPNTTEIATKDHGLTPSLYVNSIGWEVQCENLACDDNIESLITILNNVKNNTPVDLVFAKASNFDAKGIVDIDDASEWTAGTTIIGGKALLTNFSINAPAQDNATLSATFTGIGDFMPASGN